jgi:PAS domain S-box-containing protein
MLHQTDARIRATFAASAEGLIVYADDGRVIAVNTTAECLLNLPREQILGTAAREAPWDVRRLDGTALPCDEYAAVQALQSRQTIRNQVVVVPSASVEPRWVSIDAEPMAFSDGDGVYLQVIVTVRDVTEGKRSADAIRSAWDDLQTTIDNVPACISVWNTDGTNKLANQGVQDYLAASPAELAGVHVRDALGENRYAQIKPYFDAALGGSKHSYEEMDPQHDGSVRWRKKHWQPQRSNGEVVGVLAWSVDTTEERRALTRMKELVQRLDLARELERKALAITLHDEIAQELFALKLAMGKSKRGTKTPRQRTASPAGVDEGITRCIASLKGLADSLFPTDLILLPLVDALQSHAQTVCTGSGLTIQVVEFASFPTLTESMRLVLYRTAQEALLNIVRHAHAATGQIRLSADRDWISMEITDDGIGIADDALHKPGAFGLLSMRERIEALGGEFSTRRNEPAGTRLWVRLPVQLATT